MGAIAAGHADRIVVTSDNPRSEDPAAIADAVARGAREAGHRRFDVELDRRAAIARAIASAAASDIVLVAGKGHETYQEVNGKRLPFSDAREAEAALARWSAA
jgi:UDP-N-acetylmuramoyl-L-alanyl-D-glutamate--2,6-diaminopimelate ligase